MYTRKKMKKKITTISKTQVFQREKPRFNAFQNGTGMHGDRKYNRNKLKYLTRKEMQEL